MGEQAELSLEGWGRDDEEEREVFKMVECMICGELYLNDGESGCCIIE